MSHHLSFRERLKATLRRRGVTDTDAEDIIQEAHAKLQSYQQTQSVDHSEAFLVRVSLNLAIDAGRRRGRNPVSAADIWSLPIADPSPGPAEILDSKQRLHRMTEGLAAMTAKNRSILLAHRVEGLTYPEIARREGITVSAVERQISRAVAFLVAWMEGW